jgi:hypothetical protein
MSYNIALDRERLCTRAFPTEVEGNSVDPSLQGTWFPEGHPSATKQSLSDELSSMGLLPATVFGLAAEDGFPRNDPEIPGNQSRFYDGINTGEVPELAERA